MKSKKLGSLICLILVLNVFIPAIALAYAERPVRVPVIIGFKGAADLDLIAAFDGKVKYVYTIISAIAIDLPEEAVSRIANAKGVAYVEPDYVVEALGEGEILPWGVDRIDADVVHTYPNNGSGAQVAIIDTGIDYDHPDLALNYLCGYDFVNNDGDPMDDNGHGTHCAGTVAAVDNELGVIGVAPEVGLYALKVLDSTGGGYVSDIIAGIQWAVLGPDKVEGNEDDAEVASMSLGGSKESDALKDACDSAYASGTLIVAAAGNSGTPPGKGDNVLYPAKYDTVIAVAATDENDERARWSSTGPDVELSAPGVSIYSTYLDDTYATGSGTSMACPHVSGVAALVYVSPITDVYDLNNNTIWDADEIRKKMDDTAIDFGPTGRDEMYGYGLIYAVDAVATVDKPEVHDIAVTNIEAPTWVVQGDPVNVDVIVENQGTYDETFNVVLTDETDTVKIGDQSITLSAGSSTIVSFSWDTSGATVEEHILTASHDFTDDDPSNDVKSTTVTVTEQGATMHVGDLDGVKELKGKSGRWEGFITVTIHDESHIPLSDASVRGEWSGAMTGTVFGTTGSDGTVTFSTGNMSGGDSVTFTVTAVEHSSLTYDPTQNHDPDPDDEGEGTWITV